MTRVLLDDVERAQLCDLLDELGPDAPTLLGLWTTRDIAAHLALRDLDHLAGPGLVLPGWWGRFAERRRQALAQRDFAWLVATIRSGPPPGFFRIRWVRQGPNLSEFFVHHEDVRRANGRAPRQHEPEVDEALWKNVHRAPWFLARRLHGAGLELHWAETVKTLRARRGRPTASINGPPGELLLYLFGRQTAAHVELTGPPAAVQAVRREHPWLPEVLARRRLMAASVLDAIEEIHANLIALGLSLDEAVVAYRIMWQFTLGTRHPAAPRPDHLARSHRSTTATRLTRPTTPPHPGGVRQPMDRSPEQRHLPRRPDHTPRRPTRNRSIHNADLISDFGRGS